MSSSRNNTLTRRECSVHGCESDRNDYCLRGGLDCDPVPFVNRTYLAADAVHDAIERAVQETRDDGKSDLLDAIRTNVDALAGGRMT